MKQPKFKEGDIITCARNGFRRKIRSVEQPYYVTGRIGYTYYEEEIDSNYGLTGEFDRFRIGCCSEEHLLRWQTR